MSDTTFLSAKAREAIENGEDWEPVIAGRSLYQPKDPSDVRKPLSVRSRPLLAHGLGEGATPLSAPDSEELKLPGVKGEYLMFAFGALDRVVLWSTQYGKAINSVSGKLNFVRGKLRKGALNFSLQRAFEQSGEVYYRLVESGSVSSLKHAHKSLRLRRWTSHFQNLNLIVDEILF